MSEKNSSFPNGLDDALVAISNVNVSTDFSRMGESEGIEVTCSVYFKTKTSEILMHPDWEMNQPTERLKELFPNGYFVFEKFKEEVIHYQFLVDYEKEAELFVLKNAKKKEEPHHYYVNSIQQRYANEAISQFEQNLVRCLLQEYVKKVHFD